METVVEENGKEECSPVTMHQIQGCGERAGSRGTGQLNLPSETESSGLNGDRENSTSPDHKQVWQSYLVNAQSAEIDDVYKHTRQSKQPLLVSVFLCQK